jgi:hypothetical protein
MFIATAWGPALLDAEELKLLERGLRLLADEHGMTPLAIQRLQEAGLYEMFDAIRDFNRDLESMQRALLERGRED